MDVSLLFPSRFIKSAEFQGRDVTLTIAAVVLEDLESSDGATKRKGIVGFRETDKGWVLNRTNASCLAGMFGKETDQWIGKRVTLYPAVHKDSFTGEVGTAIRVRGSPDLTADKRVEIRLPRKKPTTVTLKATGKQQQSPPPTEPAP